MANYLQYANQGAKRNQPLNDKLTEALSYLADMGVTARVFSGGQPSSGPNRVGSHRHDHGNAGDVEFYQGDNKLSWNDKDEIPILQQIVQQGKARGISGWGAGDGYMGGDGRVHLGYGKPGIWGAGGKGGNAAGWLRQAYSGGGTGGMAVGPKGAEEYAPPREFTGEVSAQQVPAASILEGLLGRPPQEMMSASPGDPAAARFGAGPAPGVDLANIQQTMPVQGAGMDPARMGGAGQIYGTPEQMPEPLPTQPLNEPGIQGPQDGTAGIEMAGGNTGMPKGLLDQLLGGDKGDKLGGMLSALAPSEPMQAPQMPQQQSNVPDLASLINAFMEQRGKT